MISARQRWVWRAGAVLAAAVAVFALLSGPYKLLLGSVRGSTADDRPAPCLPGQAVHILDSPHISAAAAARVHYNSEPPTSGPHFAFAAPPGIYDHPVPDGLTVHALEHGHIDIQYGTGASRNDVDALKRFAKHYAKDVLLVPRPSLGTTIALTAWGRIDRLDHLDHDRIVRFIVKLRGRYDHKWTRARDC